MAGPTCWRVCRSAGGEDPRNLRLLRVARLLRSTGGATIARSLLRDRAGSALLSLLFVGVLVLQFGSLSILRAEKGAPGANITTAGDAIWYVIVTISTVGCGNQCPVTLNGRQIGTLIIVVDGIFGTLTGYLANLFLMPRKEPSVTSTAATADAIRQQLQQPRELLDEQRTTVDELERMIGDDRSG